MRPISEAIIAEARTWLGTPWHHQACVKGVGADCTGVVRGVGNALGLMRYDDKAEDTKAYRGYGRAPIPRLVVQGLDQFLDRVPRAEAGPGDVLLLRAPEPQHLAIVTDADSMIHATNARGVVETPLPEGWRRQCVGVWRYRR